MGNITTVLKEMYPGRDSYTDEEVALARRAMLAALRMAPRSMRLPSIFVPIGGEYVYGGLKYRCVKRPNVHHRDCCLGCAFNALKGPCPPAIQCSSFDRRDRTFVWFERVDG